MNLIINGEQHQISENIKTIQDLLQFFELEHRVVIIEHNLNILEKTCHSETLLSDGDRIEMVHFVGGG
jgi:sulfur carrier protein